jgi:hypothetical protein
VSIVSIVKIVSVVKIVAIVSVLDTVYVVTLVLRLMDLPIVSIVTIVSIVIGVRIVPIFLSVGITSIISPTKGISCDIELLWLKTTIVGIMSITLFADFIPQKMRLRSVIS